MELNGVKLLLMALLSSDCALNCDLRELEKLGFDIYRNEHRKSETMGYLLGVSRVTHGSWIAGLRAF